MLNPARSSGGRANDEAAAMLEAGGVLTAWTNPAFAVTHEKSMTVDGRIALIATFNFCDKYFTTTRDYGLLTDDVAIVREVESGFEADWLRHPFESRDASQLLWSNRNARLGMAELIDTAAHSLHVQHPKFSDVAILDRLLHAHERGVRLRVLCGGRHGISPSDMLDTFGALRILARAGVAIRHQHDLRLHAKLLVADGKRALLGSMNIDRSAFDLRRELGAVISDEPVLGLLERQFDADWTAARAYVPPDPLAIPPSTEAVHFSDLEHE